MEENDYFVVPCEWEIEGNPKPFWTFAIYFYDSNGHALIAMVDSVRRSSKTAAIEAGRMQIYKLWIAQQKYQNRLTRKSG